jgi:hypothetical protein
MVDTYKKSQFTVPCSSASTTCKPLLDSCTPDLFLTNAFRITELRADATAREIVKQSDKLKIMEGLGPGQNLRAGAFVLKTPPTVDQIREAVERLKDPELRIVDEFFWFWPKQFGNSASDPAMKALECGDVNEALKIWKSIEVIPHDGLTAIHNIAVVCLLNACEREQHYAKSQFSAESRLELDRLWRDSFKRWNLLALDDFFWGRVSARIKQLDDPRLSTGFSRRMQETLPFALGKVNGEFALRYAAVGRMDLAHVHVQLMREAWPDIADSDVLADLLLGPITARLKQQIELAQQHNDGNSADLISAALGLIAHAKRDLPLIKLFLGQENEAGSEYSDEVAAVCNRLQIEYHKTTGDDKTCLETLKEILPFARSDEIRQLIFKNISVTRSNVALAPIREVCLEASMAVEADPAKGEEQGQRILSATESLLTSLSAAEIPQDVKDQAANEIALTIMNCVVAFGNKTEKWNECVPLLESGLRLAVSSDVQGRLSKNLDAARRYHDLYSNLLPVASAPPLRTFNGIGFTLYGCTDEEHVSGSYLATYYFVFFAIPIFPICRYRVALVQVGRETKYRFFGQAPLRIFDKIHLAISFCLIIWWAVNIGSVPQRKGSYSPPIQSSDPNAGRLSSSALSGTTGTNSDKDRNVYRVPSYVHSELERESRAIDLEKGRMGLIKRRLDEAEQIVKAERAKTENLKVQLSDINAQTEAARKSLNRVSQASVDAFNRKVNQHNAVLTELREQNEKTNQSIDIYNLILEEARSQDRRISQLIDEYNEKLRRSRR